MLAWALELELDTDEEDEPEVVVVAGVVVVVVAAVPEPLVPEVVDGEVDEDVVGLVLVFFEAVDVVEAC